MSLDADLGIDSIKRVEILSALQEKIPSLPAVKPDQLGSLHTLQDVVSILQDSSGGPPPSFPQALTHESNESERIIPTEPAPTLAEVNLFPVSIETSEQKTDIIIRRVTEAPPPLAKPMVYAPPPEAQREIPLEEGDPVFRSVPILIDIDTSLERTRLKYRSGSRIWLVAEQSMLISSLTRHLNVAGLRPEFIAWNDSPYAYEPNGISGVILVAPEGASPEDLPLRAFRWLRRAAPALTTEARSNGAFFVTVSRLDGRFGFGSLAKQQDITSGAFSGLAKTAAHEWPLVQCKAIDLDPHFARNLSAVLADEILTAGPVEVGINLDGRVRIELGNAEPVLETAPIGPITSEDVILVTGGARGVTCESLFTLVEKSHPKIVLLGRTPLPEQEPEWLARLSQEAEIKQAIVSRMKTKPTPKEVGDEYKRIIGQREVRRNIRRLTQAGAKVLYYPCDVQDYGALTAALRDVRKQLGPITGLIHGAGVLADRKIEDLTDEQFTYVYETKVTGLRNLLTALEEDPLKILVLFSSSTGRFGRTGQIAYAAANEVLNKTAQLVARQRPACRCVALNWGPWEGGMVTPALAEVFASEGIGLISYHRGSQLLWNELSALDRPCEVVVLAQPKASAPPLSNGQIPLRAEQTLVLEREVRLKDHPILRSHTLNDRAVLPMVLHAEWLIHVAQSKAGPLRFIGFNDLRIFQGVQLDDVTPARLRLFVGQPQEQDSIYVIPVEMRGWKKDRESIHSRADILFAKEWPASPPPQEWPSTGPMTMKPHELYEQVLFHGPDLRAIERIDGVGETGIIGLVRNAPPPNRWMTQPLRPTWFADPLALDAAFQMMIVWSYFRHQSGSLPTFIGQYRQYVPKFPSDYTQVVATVRKDTGKNARADIEFLDTDGLVIATIHDYECIIDSSLNLAFRKGSASGSVAKGSKYGSVMG
jgi:NAD(P)-dependent dehydrogenase (short-subunit alcohol dehydrogenase family)